MEAHNVVPRFTVSCAANLPGVLHSLEPCIIGDEKMRRRNNVVKFRLAYDLDLLCNPIENLDAFTLKNEMQNIQSV